MPKGMPEVIVKRLKEMRENLEVMGNLKIFKISKKGMRRILKQPKINKKVFPENKSSSHFPPKNPSDIKVMSRLEEMPIKEINGAKTKFKFNFYFSICKIILFFKKIK